MWRRPGSLAGWRVARPAREPSGRGGPRGGSAQPGWGRLPPHMSASRRPPHPTARGRRPVHPLPGRRLPRRAAPGQRFFSWSSREAEDRPLRDNVCIRFDQGSPEQGRGVALRRRAGGRRRLVHAGTGRRQAGAQRADARRPARKPRGPLRGRRHHPGHSGRRAHAGLREHQELDRRGVPGIPAGRAHVRRRHRARPQGAHLRNGSRRVQDHVQRRPHLRGEEDARGGALQQHRGPAGAVLLAPPAQRHAG